MGGSNPFSPPFFVVTVKGFTFGDWALLPAMGAGGWLYGFMMSGHAMRWGQHYQTHPRVAFARYAALAGVGGAYMLSHHTSTLRLQGWLPNGGPRI